MATHAACFGASLCAMLSVLLLNGPLNAFYSTVTDWGRDWSTILGALAFVVFFGVAKFRPKALRPLELSVGSGLLTLVGHGISGYGFATQSAAWVTVGMSLSSIASSWCILLWLLACSTLSTRGLGVCLATASLCAMVCSDVAAPLAGFWVLNTADALIALALLVCAWPVTRAFFAKLAHTPRPADQEVAHPLAFLPLGHLLYGYIFAFSAALGYGLRYAEMGGTAVQNVLVALTMGGVALWALRAQRPLRADGLFMLAFALVLAGFLLVLVDSSPTASAASALLIDGYTCFELLMWFALCAVAARNPLDAIPAISWGSIANYLGVFAGALLGIATEVAFGSNRMAAHLVVAAIVVAIVLYTVATIKRFSFDTTIEGISPVPAEVTVHPVDRFEEHCAQVAAERGLTQREGEIMRLLARGNNARRIQEELTISHNTVKYHARNLYAKLNVHSQQELIDLLAREA